MVLTYAIGPTRSTTPWGRRRSRRAAYLADSPARRDQG